MSIVLNVIFTFVTAALLIIVKHQYDQRIMLEQRLYGDKKAFYGTYLETLNQLLGERKGKEFRSSRKLEKFMGKFKFMMMVQSSDDAYRLFAKFVQRSFKGEKTSPKDMGKLFLAFREDARGETSLTPKEILSTFIVDIDKVDF